MTSDSGSDSRRRAGPPAAALLLGWMALMALLSGPLGSEESMRSLISWALSPFSTTLGSEPAGEALSQASAWTLRKLLHLTEYAVLALLALRWLLAARQAGSARATNGALALSAVYAAGDELHQTFVVSRTGSAGDVLVDLLGASLALALAGQLRAERGELAHRALDVIGAVFGLAFGAPLMLMAAIGVRLNMGSPVLFRQRRCGRGERPFVLLKFRTMLPPEDESGRPLTPSQRLTPTGRILRQLSIDELPQLLNVLRGEMSLVGPRPLYLEYLPHYRERERKRHLVRPGLTGLAQVRGRNRARWDDRLELDARYVETRSLRLDLRIIAETVTRLLRRDDVMDTAIQGSLAKHRSAAAETKGAD